MHTVMIIYSLTAVCVCVCASRSPGQDGKCRSNSLEGAGSEGWPPARLQPGRCVGCHDSCPEHCPRCVYILHLAMSFAWLPACGMMVWCAWRLLCAVGLSRSSLRDVQCVEMHRLMYTPILADSCWSLFGLYLIMHNGQLSCSVHLAPNSEKLMGTIIESA